jgi:hypothetical protein
MNIERAFPNEDKVYRKCGENYVEQNEVFSISAPITNLKN